MHYLRSFAAACLVLACPLLCLADIKPASLFQDHMVLQRQATVPVWGKATPGESVTVALGAKHVTATADADGRWKTALNNLTAGGPYEMTLSGSNTITIKDVLVGDVWLCSGQSNMGFAVREGKDAATEIAAANYPKIRQFGVGRGGSLEPQDSCQGNWTVCTPQTVGGFSAVAYYFGRELHQKLDIPIGLLHSSYGGTPAEAWTSVDALEASPTLKNMADEQIARMRTAEADRAAFPAKLLAWEQKYNVVEPENIGFKNGWAAADCDTSDWKKVTLGINYDKGLGVATGGAFWFRKEVQLPASAAGKTFRLTLGWLVEQYHTIYFNGEMVNEMGHKAPDFYTGVRWAEIPGRLVKEGRNVIAVRFVSHTSHTGFYVPGQAMALPVDDPASVNNEWLAKVEMLFPALPPGAIESRPALNTQSLQNTSSALYNFMIHPILTYAIKGAIWYQGENNAGRAYQYQTLLPVMIRDWRARWGQGDFPFFIQQLVNYGEAAKTPENSAWAELREAQSMTANSVPNTVIACGIDIGEAYSIHPKDKQSVGHRLALAALAQTYGQSIEYSGPRYDSMSLEGAAIRINFTHADGLKSADSQALQHFSIAGEDQKFVWASAKIDGTSVIVSNVQITKPMAVRYAWENNPQGVNLVNTTGLPALPFRTDKWPGITVNNK